MAAKASLNIFGQKSEGPNSQTVANMFSIVSNDQNCDSRPVIKQTVAKRETFRNEIRRAKNEQKRKVMRNDLVRSLDNRKLFALIESLAEKDDLESKNISNLIMDLRNNIADLDFCRQLNEQDQVKKFVLSLYLNNQEKLPLEQKCLLLSCLMYLTFYHMHTFDLEQKQKLNEMMMKEIVRIDTFDELNIEYLRVNIDLLTNIISDEDQDINLYLLDTSIFTDIADKITQIANEGQKMAQSNRYNQQIRYKYETALDDIRDAFISMLLNLSIPDYQNDSFFEFTIGELVGDENYLLKNGVTVLKILTNFFRTQKFRLKFIQTNQLALWFEKQVSVFCQKKFINHKYQNSPQFSQTKLTKSQRELFCQFIYCMLMLVQEGDGDYIEWQENYFILIEVCLNKYCLSEFLIQCSQNDPNDGELLRNSRHVSEAIKMYEFLASHPDRYDNLLTVTSERGFEDIFMVLLDQTYFTSYKISENTISLLNKLLGEYPQFINTMYELRVFDSIDCFLSQQQQFQKPEQIVNFFDLLTLMVDSDICMISHEEVKRKSNFIAMKIEQPRFIKRIQHYQNHQNRNVSDKAYAFLEYLGTVRENHDKGILDI